jgi:hypothetical protein
MSATLTFVSGELVELVLVERLFDLTRDKLLKIPAFAWACETSAEADAAECGNGYHDGHSYAKAKEHISRSPLARRILKPRHDEAPRACSREIAVACRDMLRALPLRRRGYARLPG